MRVEWLLLVKLALVISRAGGDATAVHCDKTNISSSKQESLKEASREMQLTETVNLLAKDNSRGQEKVKEEDEDEDGKGEAQDEPEGIHLQYIRASRPSSSSLLRRDERLRKRHQEEEDEEEPHYIEVSPNVQTQLINQQHQLLQHQASLIPSTSASSFLSSFTTSKPTDSRHLSRRINNNSLKQPQQPPAYKLADITSGAIYGGSRSTSSASELSRLYLDSNTPVEVEAQAGTTAYLLCRLRLLQAQAQEQLQVSWVRKMQILASGTMRYTSDERFRATHVPGSRDWLLEIENVSPDDEGAYECQVNTEPRPASFSLNLRVTATTIEILEPNPVQIEEEEPIRLTCRLGFSSRPLGSQRYIYWYKDNNTLQFNNPRGGISVEKRETGSSLESRLTIEGATVSDQGLYTCKLLPEIPDLQPAQVQVLVGQLTTGSGTVKGKQQSGAIWWLLMTVLVSILNYHFYPTNQNLNTILES